MKMMRHMAIAWLLVFLPGALSVVSAQETPAPDKSSSTLSQTHWSLGTNLVDYADFGTLNLEGSVAVARRITLHTGVKFNPWEFQTVNPDGGAQEILRDRRFTAAAGIRVWPWYIYSGWWFGTKLQYEMYNQANILGRWFRGLSHSPRGWNTEEGHAFGLGVSAGYTMMLHKNLNLDVGLGLWAGPTFYT
ncbi:MAG: DUF3575 domain-containing protein, partial [Bacteroidales bacterium]|nr:DUF3575 domain-containing protein [Bacteroidales bacterium]